MSKNLDITVLEIPVQALIENMLRSEKGLGRKRMLYEH
jgi:hypothetical protein